MGLREEGGTSTDRSHSESSRLIFFPIRNKVRSLLSFSLMSSLSSVSIIVLIIISALDAVHLSTESCSFADSSYSLPCVNSCLPSFDILEHRFPLIFLKKQGLTRAHIARHLMSLTFGLILPSAIDEFVLIKALFFDGDITPMLWGCGIEFPIADRTTSGYRL